PAPRRARVPLPTPLRTRSSHSSSGYGRRSRAGVAGRPRLGGARQPAGPRSLSSGAAKEHPGGAGGGAGLAGPPPTSAGPSAEWIRRLLHRPPSPGPQGGDEPDEERLAEGLREALEAAALDLVQLVQRHRAKPARHRAEPARHRAGLAVKLAHHT